MLYISTEDIRYSTVGASFKVTFSVAPDEIGYLQVLNNSFKSMNMCGIPLTAHRAEQTEPFFRNPTEEEMRSAHEYIESISTPTGVNIFDLMDEQTERSE